MRAAATASILFVLCSAFGQSPAPAFEVASVKRLNPRPGSRLFVFGDPQPKISGNTIAMPAVSLSGLIMAAYSLKDYQVLGLPATPPDMYEIAAKAAGDAAPAMDQVRLMLQTLLADRFQLKFHRETRDLPVYHLVVAKKGPKFKEVASDSTPVRLATAGVLTRIDSSPTRIADLLSLLAASIDRPVIDKTGLTGSYRIELEFARGNGLTDDSGAPPIAAALKEQLGLELEPVMEPTEVLVVDHVERASGD